MVGALALADLCEQAEAAGRNRHWETLQALRPQLLAEAERLARYLDML